MATLARLSDYRPKTRPESQLRWKDLLFGTGLLWSASVARVIIIFSNHERFGLEAALAVACVLLLPWLLSRSRSAKH